MKACKIILIVLLVLKSLTLIVESLASENPWDNFALVLLFELPFLWLLYWGAGVLDI